MAIQINNIKTDLDTDFSELKSIALKKLSKNESDCLSFKVLKQSIDARKKNISFVYSVLITLKNEKNIPKNHDILFLPEENKKEIIYGTEKLSYRPVIVGAGPCGLFLALTLARHGYKPILIERGSSVDERTKAVKYFWDSGKLDVNSNVQFGEGGAGTFSDGKLTTRINDRNINEVLSDFVKFGAKEDILYKAKPHIGTDILSVVVKNIREEIISLGGEVRFNTKLEKIHISNKKINKITLSTGDEIPCDVLCLAIGHSARDTYEMLYNMGIDMIVKPFSVGVRIEHLRKDIDSAMYGDFAGHPALGAASYQLSYRNGNDRCYSFCMCPGGVVVAAASEEDTVVTNGMSYHARNMENSNAALCVNVDESDFGDNNPLSAIAFQQKLEKAAFITGGKNYKAPCQTVGDFLNKRPTKDFGKVTPSFTGGVNPCDLIQCLPIKVSNTLSDALLCFDTKISGYADRDAVLTGIETRTSAPVRILRNEELQSTSVLGLYPCGEGAGYAGGIMSAAVDGINVATTIMKRFSPLK
ncbi:MAG: FAD-dependent monooxygenase [Clostridia bacterium]|nr:FAD-dependent monooxygenase [Clostridia bacterium]